VKTLILSQSDVASVLEMKAAVVAVERAFRAHGAGDALMPAKVYLPLPQHHGDFRAMPAYFDGSAGVKWVNAHPENPKRHGLPSVLAVYILSDPETAAPLAIMDGTLLTAVRTGAAAAVASKHLGKGAPRKVGFIGSGVQARFLLEAHRAVFPDGFEILAADVATEAALRFATEVGGRAVAIEEAAACEVVCTATPSRSPIVRREWVRAGTHINALGADAPGKQELDPRILQDAKVVIDDWEQATESGEVNVPIHLGIFSRASIHATLGEVLAGKKAGREGDEITVFDSTGLAIQDLAVAKLVYDAARARNLGFETEIVSEGGSGQGRSTR
jgi:alanine dehydrogenase